MASNQMSKKRGQKLSLKKKENNSKGSAIVVLPNVDTLNESSEFKLPKKGTGLVQATPFQLAVEEDVVDVEVSCQVCSKDLSHMNSTRRLQHVNRCMDRQEEGEKCEEKGRQLLQAARNLVLDCPICGKVCNTELSRKNHLKKCCVDQGVSTDRMLQLVRDQELERETSLAAGVIPPALRSKLPKAPAAKKRKLKEPKSQFEEDVQVALAMSSSLAGHAVTEVTDRGHVGRNKKGKTKEVLYTLLLTTEDERLARIQQRVSSLLSQQPCLARSADMLPSSSLCVPSPTPGASLWGRGGGELLPLEQYYVGALMPPVTLGALATGPRMQPLTTGPDIVLRESEVSVAPGVDDITASTQTAVVLAELAGDSQVGCNLSRSQPRGAVSGFERAQGSHDLPLAGDCSQRDLGTSGFCVQKLVLKSEDQARLIQGLCQELSSLLNNPEFSDVKVQSTEGVIFHAHRAVLGVRCRKLIEKVEEGVIKLPASSATVSMFLRYLYTGELNLAPHIREEFCTLADTLQLKELNDVCSRLFLEEVTVGGDAGNDDNDDNCNNDNQEFVESQIDLKAIWGESDTDDDVDEVRQEEAGDSSAQSRPDLDYDQEDCRDVACSQWKHAARKSLDGGNEAFATGSEVSSEPEAADIETGRLTDVSCGEGDVSDNSDGRKGAGDTSDDVCGHASVRGNYLDGPIRDVSGGGYFGVVKSDIVVKSQRNKKTNTQEEGTLSEKRVIDHTDNIPSSKRLKLLQINTADTYNVIDLCIEDDAPVETSRNTSTLCEQSSIDLFNSPSPPRKRLSVIPKGFLTQDSLNNSKMSLVNSPERNAIKFSTPVEASNRVPNWKGRFSSIPHASTPTSNKQLHLDTMESHGQDTTIDTFAGNKNMLDEDEEKSMKGKYFNDGSICDYKESDDVVEIVGDNLDDVSFQGTSGFISYSPAKQSVDSTENSPSPTFTRLPHGKSDRESGQNSGKKYSQKLPSTKELSFGKKYSAQLKHMDTTNSESDSSEVVVIDAEGGDEREMGSCHGNLGKIEDEDVHIDDGNATFTNEGVWDNFDDPGVCYEPPVQSPVDDYDVGYDPPVQSELDQDADLPKDGNEISEEGQDMGDSNEPVDDENMAGVQFSDDDSFMLQVDEVPAMVKAPTNMKLPVAANVKPVSTFTTPSVRKKCSTVGKKWEPPSPFTPMPDYPQMPTPALKKEIQKFGVKPVGKKRMIKVLVDIYKQTHQYETDSEVEDEAGSEDSHGHVTSEGDSATCREDSDITPSQDSQSGDSEYDVLEESCLHFDDSDSRSSPTKSADLPRKLTEFIEQNATLHTRVLMYEPLELDILKAEVKAAGIKCSMDKLMDFLDERCIAFTSKNSRKKAPQRGGRGRKPVKRSEKASGV
ncbi:structure-specific endonuclease subunit SLX4-like isoform X2 [Dreissena polymorpha]|uniref:Structure-specific endonuclease subunit SLX4 n=1 Tax=Dreissena polymorpha TaxID=45954 RepID=A0A9D4QI28_DREPO|nr:structure-specific endonuclease subunit SLX4-like isoform X2 [Dreissena polymorpha]KAH3832456.1 hypothetical protein DPMN_105744 [Dreissena polymorpha]